jgi:hypothetical protein
MKLIEVTNCTGMSREQVVTTTPPLSLTPRCSECLVVIISLLSLLGEAMSGCRLLLQEIVVQLRLYIVLKVTLISITL